MFVLLYCAAQERGTRDSSYALSSPEKAIFIFVNNVLPPSSSLLSQVYQEHMDEDGFLYVLYSSENTFGETAIGATPS